MKQNISNDSGLPRDPSELPETRLSFPPAHPPLQLGLTSAAGVRSGWPSDKHCCFLWARKGGQVLKSPQLGQLNAHGPQAWQARGQARWPRGQPFGEPYFGTGEGHRWAQRLRCWGSTLLGMALPAWLERPSGTPCLSTLLLGPGSIPPLLPRGGKRKGWESVGGPGKQPYILSGLSAQPQSLRMQQPSRDHAGSQP